MPGAFLWQDLVGSAPAITAPRAITPSMPLANLRDPQPRIRTRFTPLGGGAFTILVDLGADVLVECVALISTSLGPSASVNATARLDDPTSGTIVWATGTISAATSDALNGNVVLLPASPAPARFLSIGVVGGTTVVDIGRVVAGPLWRLARGHAYGISEGRVVLDRRDRNDLTGAEFVTPGVFSPRYARFTLPSLSPEESRVQHRAMVAALGAAGDALWIPELGDTLAERNARSIWGAIATPGGATGLAQTLFTRFERSFDLVERP